MEPRFPESACLDRAQRIGAGGSGIVYSAQHARWGKVAVKVALDSSSDIRQLFVSEFSLLRSFRHRAILRALDYFYLEDGRPVLITPLCDRGDFYQHTDQLPLEERFRPLAQVLSAIEYLHLLGLVHRDLKGENILVSSAEGAQLSDLGLAARRDNEARERGGTLEYMAPEVIDNRGATPESDIYSLGVVLYRLATGELPFVDADPIQIVSRKQQPDSLPIARLEQATSQRFARLVRQCLDPDPAERPKTIKDVAEQLAMDELFAMSEFSSLSFPDFFHHYIYSYNAGYCRQDLKQLPRNLRIRHNYQEPGSELAESIIDHLKLEGYSLTRSGDEIEYQDARNPRPAKITLVADMAENADLDYPELDRFALDAILGKIFTKDLDPGTTELIHGLTSGNIMLARQLFEQLEQNQKFDLRSGRLRLPYLEISVFQAAPEYYRLAERMLPAIPERVREVAEFLSAETGGFPVRELIDMGRFQREAFEELVACGFLDAKSGHISRGYYRSCVYRALDRETARRFHLGWIKVIEETDDLDPILRERLLLYHCRQAGVVSPAIAAALRLADLLKNAQKVEEAALVTELALCLENSKVELPQYIALLMKRADLLNTLGDFNGALSLYSAVVRHGLRTGDKESVATAYKRSGDVYKGKRDFRRGKRALDNAVRHYAAEGDELELSHCYNNIGNINWIIGDLNRAAENYEKALAIQRALGVLGDIASTLSNLGSLRCYQLSFAAGIPLFKESIEIKKQLNDLPELARTYNNLSVAYFEQDELVTAQEYLKQAFDINRTLRANSELRFNFDNFFEIEFRRGNYARAREWVIEGLKNSPRDAHAVRGEFIASLANLSILDGRYGKAGALLAAAKAREEKVTDRMLSMRLASTSCEYYLALHGYQAAHNHIATAIEHAQYIGENKSRGSFLIRRARIERAIGRPQEEILASLAESESLLAPMSVKREKLELILEYAELAYSRGEMEEVERRLGEAIEFPEFDGIATFRSKLYLLRGMFEMQRGQAGKAIQFVNDAVLASQSLRTLEMLWYSQFVLGECHHKLKNVEQSLKAYIEAFKTVKHLAGEISDKRLRKLYLSDKRKAILGKRLEEMSTLVA
jgi:serine/threonine protein kinase/tetratricopeptide (TPR) repeat protein